jgi:hypothetical protein
MTINLPDPFAFGNDKQCPQSSKLSFSGRDLKNQSLTGRRSFSEGFCERRQGEILQSKDIHREMTKAFKKSDQIMKKLHSM